MAQQVAESIWHFAGYLHLQDLLNLTPHHYAGAPHLQTPSYTNGKTGGDYYPRLRWPEQDDYESPKISADDPATDLFKHFPGPSPAAWAAKIAAAGSGPFAPAAPLTGPQAQDFASYTSTAYTISLSYRFGETQALAIASRQGNVITDDDFVIGDPALVAGSDLAAASAHVATAAADLADLVALARASIPQDFAETLPDWSAGTTAEHLHSTDDALPLPANATGVMPALQVEPNGQYVDGARISDSGQSRAEQSGDLVTLSKFVTDDVVEPGNPAATAQVFNELGASGGAAHITSLGGNAAVNVAVLQDFGDAYGSIIIQGNYSETNAIIQINVLSDTNIVADYTQALIGELAGESNSLHNEASFTNAAGEVYGDVGLGGYNGATDWHVDYIYGDYYDVTMLSQYNLLSDNDVNFGTPTLAHHSAVLGDNGQLNALDLGELGKQYDLIIIAGDYHKFNGIIQVNVLNDNDNVTLIGTAPAAGEQSIAADGNSFINDAAIHSVGGLSFKPMSDYAADLAEAIGNTESEFGHEMALALPGNGDDVFDVLYVTGDYYTYNLIYQANVISDADYSQDSMAGSNGDFQQETSSGGNLLANGALIIDQDSTSDYQFLGGDFYEESILVQANILGDGDEYVSSDGGLHDDVVAAVAAMTESSDAASAPDTDSGAQNTIATEAVDVMGGVLA